MYTTAVSNSWGKYDLDTGNSLQKLNSTLLKDEFLQILKDRDLFWQLFCQKCANLKLECQPEVEKWIKERFRPEIYRDKLSIYGKSHLDVAVYIEIVRRFCSASMQKKGDPCDLIFSDSGDNIDLLSMDLNGYPLNHHLFTFYVRPALLEVFKSLGCSIEQKRGTYMYRFGQGYSIDPNPQKPMKRDTPHSNSCSYLHICWGTPSSEGEEKKGS